MTAVTAPVQPLLLVETAADLPADDNAWTIQRYIRAIDITRGMSQIVGNAVLEQPFGLLLPEYERRFVNIGVAPDIAKTGLGTLNGKLVRILVQDDAAGTIQRGSGIYRHNYSAKWWGQIIRERILPDGAAAPNSGGVVQWTAAGLASVLDQVRLRSGRVRSADGSTAVDPGFLPPFNALPGGDRSSATFTVNGAANYTHDLSTTTSGNPWTALQILNLALALARDPQWTSTTGPTGLTWAISDPTNCLAYIAPTIRAHGMTVAGLLNALCSPQRGLVWWVTVAGSTATINVQSGLAAPISMPGYSIPAASLTATLDQAASILVSQVDIEENVESCYDVIELQGARPWGCAALQFTGPAGVAADSLQKGWSGAAETAWPGTTGNGTLYANVWRRFELKPGWNFQSSTATGPNGTARATDASYGTDGFTGARTYPTTTPPPATVLQLESLLPVSPGFGTLRIGQRQAPVIIVGNLAAGYIDKSNDWTVAVENDPPAVLINDKANGDEIAGFLAAGYTLFVTIGVRLPTPLRVSWQRDASLLPRSAPRIFSQSDPDQQLWEASTGTLTGIDPTGVNLQQLSGDTTARDDRPAMRQRLALLRAWFGAPDYAVSWKQQGVADFSDTWRAGALLTSVQRGDRTITPNVVITTNRISLVQRDGAWTYDTDYATERILPDTEILL